MPGLTLNHLRHALGALNLGPAELLLLHFDLLAAGRLADCPVHELPSRYYSVLRQRTSSRATLVVATHSPSFAAGTPFDRQLTPTAAPFNEYLRRLPRAHRSAHALQSLAAEGPLAHTLCARDTPAAFGPGSAFDTLLALNARALFIGLDLQHSPLLHIAESRARVPYLDFQELQGPWVDQGLAMERRFLFQQRRLPQTIALSTLFLSRALAARGHLEVVPFGRTRIILVEAARLVDTATELLLADPHALLRSRPPPPPATPPPPP
ncbi:AAC(3) family N-acetyltransferase [Lujinxingia litoralis]|uniref:AAC(3) family N-acetyltransferase n=1 Tax=Lujinxingia litoralis TaxID=2211119 RepID=UPI00131444DD|nr:AAC(3) family N-acetyltransferase [Lujinxingia litoralis]